MQQSATLPEQFAALQLDNDKLTSQHKEVIQMNTHWQRYDTQREKYVLQLSTANHDLQQNVSSLRHQLQQEKKRAVGVTDTKLHDEKTRDLKEPVNPREGNRDGGTVNALTQTVQKLQEKILDLEMGRASMKKEDDDQLTMLREQINVCIEDFKQERTDRERIQEENDKLRERLARAEQQAMENNEQVGTFSL